MRSVTKWGLLTMIWLTLANLHHDSILLAFGIVSGVITALEISGLKVKS